jgi:VanZ family protein
MLDEPLHENERTSWFYVGIWSLFIFMTVPLAREIQAYVSEHWGRDMFMHGVIITVIIMLCIALLKLQAKRRVATAKNYLWLIGISGAFVAYTIQLRKNPEESVHFVQYGILAILVYRALTHRIADNGIYIVAVLITATIGITDEAIQWLTPKRHWGLRDIWLDTIAAALALLALAKGLEPGIASGPPTRATAKALCRAALCVVLLLGASLLNTPQRISWYVSKLPGLDFIVANSSVMAEYGYRYHDEETGVFRSRLAPADLKKTDTSRAAAAAANLDLLPAPGDYGEFLRRYTPFNDPFLHEARVRLNRRDYYLQSAAKYKDRDINEFRRRMTIAHYENRIMEKYFPETLSQSGFLLPAGTVSDMKESAFKDITYESAVSEALLTQVNEQQVLWASLILAVFILVMQRRLSGRFQP